ncbi:MAG: aminotransferase class III-fold pyridoxal phosphate-dependent enzyme [Legionellaceae bacterium]|nr:aminotransferase class III-fold pyridoxal phosphate-dependent enzyme [Legionellaceae bacterium]
MNIVAIVQARMGSTRFPGKVMRPICGMPMIGLLLERLSLASMLNQIIVATSVNEENVTLTKYLGQSGHRFYCGSETDVLGRYYEAAQYTMADVIVRITGDCPLIDPEIVDVVIKKFIESDVDYASNISPPTYPDGLDVEVFNFHSLEKAYLESKLPKHREHVTSFLRESDDVSSANYFCEVDYSHERWTVDEAKDFEVVRAVFEKFHPQKDFGWREILDLRQSEPKLFEANSDLIRNDGAQMGTGQKLWKRAKSVIPGGNMLLSKRPEMFLPELWPSYYSKAQGCTVWDLDGKEYIDMSMMGIGTNLLGYCHPEVDEAVRCTVSSGNMSTLNCSEEVYLAEKLIELHPWADMARFARTGGEANAIAIRIARAASGKEKVAFCGYHGWHDWYLAANLGDEKTLSGHLLPGLEPTGIPSTLRDTIYPFNYNQFDELQELVNVHDIGVIKMEVSRNQGPEPGFLENVRQLATDRGIVLIFDECTSGFRQINGGLHKLYGVEPDMAVFGKALGNGYAITAMIGRRDVMEAAQTSFISSTFWTERIGPTAALKTLEVMEKVESWDVVTATGNNIRQRWIDLAENHRLKLSVSGLPALSGFSFESQNVLAYKTLITQEMLAKGWLAGNSVYTSLAHTPEIINAYFEALDPVFALIAECEAGRDVMGLLNGPVCHAGFKRLN